MTLIEHLSKMEFDAQAIIGPEEAIDFKRDYVQITSYITLVVAGHMHHLKNDKEAMSYIEFCQLLKQNNKEYYEELLVLFPEEFI